MGVVIPFPFSRAIKCETVSIPEMEAARAALVRVMGSCPTCTGRGYFLKPDPWFDLLVKRCPCGGTDADRIDLPDFEEVSFAPVYRR